MRCSQSSAARCMAGRRGRRPRRLQDSPRRPLHSPEGAEHGLARATLPRDVRGRWRLEAEDREHDVRGRFRLGLLLRMRQSRHCPLPRESAGPLRLVEDLVRELVREAAHPIAARERGVHLDAPTVRRSGEARRLPHVSDLDPETRRRAFEGADVPRAAAQRFLQDRKPPSPSLPHVEDGDPDVPEAATRRSEDRDRPFAWLDLAAQRLPRPPTSDEGRVRALDTDGELVERRVAPEDRHRAQRLVKAGVAPRRVHLGGEPGKVGVERVAKQLPVELGRRVHASTVPSGRTRSRSSGRAVRSDGHELRGVQRRLTVPLVGAETALLADAVVEAGGVRR